jgi:hypothetical protein
MNAVSVMREFVNNATNSADADAVNRFQSIVDRVVCGVYSPHKLEYMGRISDNSAAPRSSAVQMIATDDSGTNFELLSGRDVVGDSVWSLNKIVSMTGGSVDEPALIIFGSTHMAKSLKAMLHVHQMIPQLEPLAIMKAFVNDLSLADQPNERVLQVLELSSVNVSAGNDKQSIEPVINENANSIKFRR